MRLVAASRAKHGVMRVFPLSGMRCFVQKYLMLSHVPWLERWLEPRRLALAAIALCGLLPVPAIAAGCLLASQGEGRVTQVIDPRTLRLDDGRDVILAGIEPVAPDDGSDAGNAKRTASRRCRRSSPAATSRCMAKTTPRTVTAASPLWCLSRVPIPRCRPRC
jgi:hypothetical protein